MNEYLTKSEEETISLGRKFAEQISPGKVIGLKGNLGTGKTRFVKGIAEYFEVNEIVNSPTFLIVNQYSATEPETNKKIDIFHFDLYRINTVAELEVLGFSEYINDNSVVLIEWPELAEKFLNGSLEKVCFNHGKNENERIIKF